MAEKKSDPEEHKQRHERPPLLEWIVAAAGAILVAGAIGFMLYQAMTQNAAPPDFSFQVDSITPTAAGYLVKFQVENAGQETASEVVVEGELKSGAESVEKSSALFNYIPSHSRRAGGLFFTRNPQEFELQLRAAGYSAR
jgi:uncharacterized protein (TIGR02588 family)